MQLVMLVPVEKPSFRRAARTSLVPDGGVLSPSYCGLREDDDRRAILDCHLQRHLRSQWVDAIICALRSDILAASGHA